VTLGEQVRSVGDRAAGRRGRRTRVTAGGHRIGELRDRSARAAVQRIAAAVRDKIKELEELQLAVGA